MNSLHLVMLLVRLKCSWPKTSTNWNIIMDVTFIVIACIQVMKIDETITPRRSCRYTLQNGGSKKNLCNTDKLRLGKINEDKNTQNCQKQPQRKCYFKKAALKNFAKFAGRHLFWVFFLIILLTWGMKLYSKRDSNAGVFLWILRNF